MNIYVKAFWVKPWFKDGYTLYRVIREDQKLGSDYPYQTTIFETISIEEAVDFRDEMIERGVQ